MKFIIPLILTTCLSLDGKDVKKEIKIPQNTLNIYKDVSIAEKKGVFSATKGEFLIPGIPLQSFNDSIHLIFNSKDTHKIINHIVNQSNTDKTLTFFTTSPAEHVNATITYATEGLTWQPFYTADISPDSTMLNLNCWFTIKNNTNISYDQASLTLHDGKSGLNFSKVENLQFQSRDVSYVLETPITLSPQNQTCVGWVLQNGIPIQKEFQLNMGGIFLSDLTNKEENPKIETWLKCKNTFKSLPEGVLTLYQQAQDFSKHPLHNFVLRRIPLQEDIALKMPENYENSLDKTLKVTYEQTEFQKFTTHLVETANRLTLQNMSDELVQIRILINFPCKGGMVLRESLPSQKQGEHKEWLSNCSWVLEIQPQEKIDLKYRLRFHID